MENHFILITEGEMQHIAISQLYYHMCTRATNFVMYQHISMAKLQCVIILATSDLTSVQTYDPLTSGGNSRQSYTPYTSAKQVL